MTMVKFAANLDFLFKYESSSIIERLKCAAAGGFKGVEIPNPYSIDPSVLAMTSESCDVEPVLLNSWPGNTSSGDCGIGIFADRCGLFQETLELSIQYLNELKCRRLHILAGMRPTEGAVDVELEETFVKNLQLAAARLEHEGVLALVEPISSFAKPGYWLDDPITAVRIVRRVAHPNLRLQLDFFHAQIVGGNLTQRIRDWAPLIGHVQIAQVPNRSSPDSDGELNYKYILRELVKSGYDGWIGLEYWPPASTSNSLNWLKDWGYW